MKRTLRRTSKQTYRKFLRLIFIAAFFMIIYGGLDGNGSQLFGSMSTRVKESLKIFGGDIYFSTNVTHHYIDITTVELTHMTVAIFFKKTRGPNLGSDVDSALTLIKSALIFSKGVYLHFILFTDAPKDKIQGPRLNQKLNELIGISQNLSLHFDYKIIDTVYPWNDCRSQNYLLMLPAILTQTDALIYMKTDTIFISSVKDIWGLFTKMNSQQFVGLPRDLGSTPEFFSVTDAQGIAFLNLTRMRQINLFEEMISICKTYRTTFDHGFQDIFLIQKPDSIYKYSCDLNYQQDYCLACKNWQFSCHCDQGNKEGMSILNGNVPVGNVPVGNVPNKFLPLPLKVILQHFQKFKLRTGSPWKLLDRIENDLNFLLPSRHDYPCLKSAIPHGNLLLKFRDYLTQLQR